MLSSVLDLEKSTYEAACHFLKTDETWKSWLSNIDIKFVTTTSLEASIVFLIISTCLILLTLSGILLTFLWKKDKIVKAGAPVLMHCVSFGVLLIYVSVILDSLQETTMGTCLAREWIYHVGFVLTMSAIFLKSFRLNSIFKLKACLSVKSEKPTQYSDQYML
eukprot:Awhi_evm2s5610